MDSIFKGLSNPVLATAIVFVPLFGALSLLDCFLGREGWYLIDLKQTADANHYFSKQMSLHPIHSQLTQPTDLLKTAPPVHRVHIECFHTDTKSAINTATGSIGTK